MVIRGLKEHCNPRPKFCSRLGKGTVSEKLLCYVPNTAYGPCLIQRISEKSALAVEINLTWSRRSVECQYAALNSQNCLEEQIRCLDYKTRYAVLSRKLDTSYPTGGYGVSGDQSEQNTI
ncbi:hypothetical protein Tco_0527950 [Tanacetum coccineum]